MAEPGRGLRRLHLIMGLQCNVRCIMCYQTDYGARHNMPQEIFAEHLKDVYPEVTSVKIQGGEPTIMDNCRQFATLVRRYPHIKLSVSTNGLAVSQFWRETFLDQGGHINFSLNAAQPHTYARIVRYGDFTKVLDNVAHLIGNRRQGLPTVSLSAVLLAHNVGEISGLISLGRDLGVDRVIFLVDPWLTFADLPRPEEIREELARALALVSPQGPALEGLDAFARRFGVTGFPRAERQEGQACRLAFNNLVVDQRGEARICCDTWRSLGNTYTRTLAEILDSRARRGFQARMARGDYSWCDPHCPDNPAPRRRALLDKYLCLAAGDPREFCRKAWQKLRRRRQAPRA